MRLSRRSWLVLPLLAAAVARADNLSVGERYVRAARELIGVPYQFGGRLLRPGDGIDCQGVLFYGAERIGACGWKSYSVYPTVSVARSELGAPVPGLAPISSDTLEIAKLKAGDVLLLVGFTENPAEPAIGYLREQRVWVWHTGMYSGKGKWIVGDHFAGKVVETDLATYLREHSDTYAGVFVTRMDSGPQPLRCREHQPMKLPLRPKNKRR